MTNFWLTIVFYYATVPRVICVYWSWNSTTSTAVPGGYFSRMFFRISGLMFMENIGFPPSDLVGTYILYKRWKSTTLTEVNAVSAEESGSHDERHVDQAKQLVLTEDNIGQTVFFGRLQSSADLSGNTAPIEWIVVDAFNGRALLLSRYVIDSMPYRSSPTSSWENSDIREWLNPRLLSMLFLYVGGIDGYTEHRSNLAEAGTVCPELCDLFFFLLGHAFSPFQKAYWTPAFWR